MLQSLQEKAQFCQLADTERRAFWVHRNARELLCQASAEAEQQGMLPTNSPSLTYAFVAL